MITKRFIILCTASETPQNSHNDANTDSMSIVEPLDMDDIPPLEQLLSSEEMAAINGDENLETSSNGSSPLDDALEHWEMFPDDNEPWDWEEFCQITP